jgi:superfamily I DNA and RNA helicase
MLDLVIGERRNPIAADSLLDRLGGSALTGTLYLGYPILASYDQPILIDALLTCREHGVVVFDFEPGAGTAEEIAELQERQDDIYHAVHQRLAGFKPLRSGRDLLVAVNVLTLTPDFSTDPESGPPFVATYERIFDFLTLFQAISASDLRSVNSAVQRVTTIKPPLRRSSVRRGDSRGGRMKQIEAEIANLDRWQKRAAIETPEGPQRIRGLAGSGKTIVLALKAAYLYALKPEWSIGVTFQTRSLYQQFTDLVRRFTFDQIQDEPDWERLKILHAWGSASEPGVYSEIAMANDIAPRDFLYGRQKYGYGEAFGGLCQELLDSLKGHPQRALFDVLLIDEAQDFPHSFFELAYLATSPPHRVIWAYDELQNLGAYSMAPPSELFGLDEDGHPRVSELRNDEGLPQQDIVLPVCYRNTPWALTIAHALGFGIYRDDGLVQFFDDPGLWRDIGYEVVSGEMSPGKPVELRRSPSSSPTYFNELMTAKDAIQWHGFPSEEEQAAWVAKSINTSIQDDELQLRDILVILADPLTAKEKAAKIIAELDKLEIAAHVAGVTTSRDVLFTDNSVAITGIYRAKGNEAPMVYLINTDYGFSGFELRKRRNILFTAITRSRAWVHVCGVGDRMDGLRQEMDKVVASDFHLAFTVPTQAELDQMRRIHRDMTPEERAKAKKIEASLQDFASLIEQGRLSLESLPSDLRRRLSTLFNGQPGDDG